MNKQQAIELIRDIQDGSDIFDRHIVPNSMRGEIAKDKWNDELFAFGCEYGAIGAIMHCFDITEKDMRK